MEHPFLFPVLFDLFSLFFFRKRLNKGKHLNLPEKAHLKKTRTFRINKLNSKELNSIFLGITTKVTNISKLF